MKIDIWSDVVCPWCYIGKRRLEKGLAQAVDSGAISGPVEVVWHSFQLDPGSPVEPVDTVAAYLGRKYGGGEEAGRRMVDKVEAVAAEEGMIWRHHSSLRVNTLDAHRLLHLALASGGPSLQGELKEALLAAYFIGAENIADHEVLRRLALATGVDADRVEEVLTTSEYADEVWADQQQAGAYGATGVPFYVIDNRYGLSGAQPAEAFVQVLQRAWAESHPDLQLVGADVDGACGPDGCTI